MDGWFVMLTCMESFCYAMMNRERAIIQKISHAGISFQ